MLTALIVFLTGQGGFARTLTLGIFPFIFENSTEAEEIEGSVGNVAMYLDLNM